MMAVLALQVSASVGPWNRMAEGVARMSDRTAVALGFVLLGGAATLDWLTGPEVASSVFYLCPIAWATLRGGRWIGLSVAVMSGGVWLALELIAHKTYANELVPYWNASVRTVMFVLISGLASEVLERKRAEARLREANEEITAASDREQRRLGEDLHDGLCQHLVSTAFAARKLSAKLTERALPEAGDATEIADLVAQAIAQAREVARGLYLVPLEEGGLASALEQLALQVRTRHRLPCEFAEKGRLPPLDESAAVNLFRIA